MDFFFTEPIPECFPQEAPGSGQMGLPSQNYAVAVVMRGESAIEVASFAAPFISFAPGFLMSIEPLNHAPSSIEILWQTTSPPSDPSLRMSTRSLAVTLPFT